MANMKAGLANLFGYLGGIGNKYVGDQMALGTAAKEYAKLLPLKYKAEYEAKQMYGSPPDYTDDIKEYNFALSQGYKGSLHDWIKSKPVGGGGWNMPPDVIEMMNNYMRTTLGGLGKPKQPMNQSVEVEPIYDINGNIIAR